MYVIKTTNPRIIVAGKQAYYRYEIAALPPAPEDKVDCKIKVKYIVFRPGRCKDYIIAKLRKTKRS